MNLTSVVGLVVAALDAAGVAYVLVGSLASSARGFPRATNDADLVADLRREHVDQLVAALQESFYIDTDAVVRAVSAHRSFNAIHHASGFKVDVFVPPPGGFGWQQLARRVAERLGATDMPPVFVATAEDMVIAKLDWFRATGGTSDRQWQDIVGIVAVQGPALDRNYLREWATRLGLADLLERAFRACEIPRGKSDPTPFR
ncbi:MAG: hypothetical protein Q7V01_07285 [Vicinamibacterales bacterium]|nr:hypothetical protein [Vicinamibacterales bacterium]